VSNKDKGDDGDDKGDRDFDGDSSHIAAIGCSRGCQRSFASLIQ
jgi:hypothetical protein